MRRKKNKQMEGQMSIFDMFSSVIENTKTEEENVTVSEGGIAAADITAVETGTQTSINLSRVPRPYFNMGVGECVLTDTLTFPLIPNILFYCVQTVFTNR